MKNVGRSLEDYRNHRDYYNECSEAIGKYISAGRPADWQPKLKAELIQISTRHNPFRFISTDSTLRTNVNPLLKRLLEGYCQKLENLIESQRDGNTDIKGSVRESFVNLILSEILPVTYRVSQGEIIDILENRSGQMDIVVEYPFLPSIPFETGIDQRLFLAEGVALTIEVKSDFTRQYEQVLKKAQKLIKLEPKVGDVFTNTYNRFDEEGNIIDYNPSAEIHLGAGRYCIPLYVITFNGYDDPTKYKSFLESYNFIEGIFDIKNRVYCSRYYKYNPLIGPEALFAFISEMFFDIRVSSYAAMPHSYILNYNPSV